MLQPVAVYVAVDPTERGRPSALTAPIGRAPGRPTPVGERDRARAAGEAEASRSSLSGKERRDKQPDPNSPFAKLAALKEQLEANAKERR